VEASEELGLLQSAKVIFICTPIGLIVPTVANLVPLLSPATVLTDVGSVKGPIVEAASELWPNFIGGHPMAGTAESGIAAAQFKLFAHRPYVLTPTVNTSVDTIETLRSLVHSLDANLYHCDPMQHDQAVAWISHLPVMVSASLITACTAEADPAILTLAQQLASSGFRDTSRVGGGNPELGLMMAQHNQSALLRSLYTYRDQLNTFIQCIEQENWYDLEAYLKHTQGDRPYFLNSEF
jgi:arogenate dehydrogenase (NADP+)